MKKMISKSQVCFYLAFPQITMQSIVNATLQYIYDALSDLVPFVQFKKREKHPWGLKPATLLKLTLLHGCFSLF